MYTGSGGGKSSPSPCIQVGVRPMYTGGGEGKIGLRSTLFHYQSFSSIVCACIQVGLGEGWG